MDSNSAPPVTLYSYRCSVLRVVMVKEGLAVPYDGGKR